MEKNSQKQADNSMNLPPKLQILLSEFQVSVKFFEAFQIFLQKLLQTISTMNSAKQQDIDQFEQQVSDFFQLWVPITLKDFQSIEDYQIIKYLSVPSLNKIESYFLDILQQLAKYTLLASSSSKSSDDLIFYKRILRGLAELLTDQRLAQFLVDSIINANIPKFQTILHLVFNQIIKKFIDYPNSSRLHQRLKTLSDIQQNFIFIILDEDDQTIQKSNVSEIYKFIITAKKTVKLIINIMDPAQITYFSMFDLQQRDNISTNSQFQTRLLEESKIVQQHLQNILPKYVLLVPNFWLDENDNVIAQSLVNLAICINLDSFSEEVDSENIKIAKAITIFFHELAHFKIGYHFNNNFWYRDSPQKIFDVDISEVGDLIDEQIFGQLEIQEITEQMAEIIIEVSNYKNLENFKIQLQKLQESSSPSSKLDKKLSDKKKIKQTSKNGKKKRVCGTHASKQFFNPFF